MLVTRGSHAHPRIRHASTALQIVKPAAAATSVVDARTSHRGRLRAGAAGRAACCHMTTVVNRPAPTVTVQAAMSCAVFWLRRPLRTRSRPSAARDRPVRCHARAVRSGCRPGSRGEVIEGHEPLSIPRRARQRRWSAMAGARIAEAGVRGASRSHWRASAHRRPTQDPR